MTTAAFTGAAGRRSAAETAMPGLLAELERIAALLEGGGGHAGADRDAASVARPSPGSVPLDDLSHRLGLSPFERDVLMLAVAVELQGSVAAIVASAQDGNPAPTFALAMSTLPDPHWDALSPERPLRRRRLVRLGPGAVLASRSLLIDESVLHRVTGLGGGRLGGLVDDDRVVGPLTASQERLADEVAAAVRAIEGRVVVRLDGADADARAGVAARIAAGLHGGVLTVRDAVVDEYGPVEAAALLDREALLDERLIATGDPRLLPLLEAEIVVTDAAADVTGRTTVARTVPLPTAAEQALLWREALAGAPAADAAVRELAHHFRLTARSIAAIATEWRSRADADVDGLRRLARERARVGFGSLARRIEPYATWDDLVLPDGQLEVLRDIERQVRHRAVVYEDWGFAGRTDRGLGISVLFAGESGTGKTMAAEVIAGSLGLDLYRIDLAALVSKYIGETEKNLGSVFDAAEAAGCVLLFDEADALFGKRSDVKDSHDRYANLEVAYLLQRMESYRGLAILTTNLRSNVDRAFVRRIRFVVQFPFPDEPARAEIWRRVFPADTPLEDFDPDSVARMQLSGGSIRGVALSAAFAAAHDGTPVRAAHLLRAAQLEAGKSERTLTDAETGDLRRGGGLR